MEWLILIGSIAIFFVIMATCELIKWFEKRSMVAARKKRADPIDCSRLKL